MRRSAEQTAAFLTAQAERMRLAPTVAESSLWTALEPLGFKFQWPIRGVTKRGKDWCYILDFYHPKAQLCIEVDGGYHKKRKGRDQMRDTRLSWSEVETLRFTNSQVKTSLDYVVARITAALTSAPQ